MQAHALNCWTVDDNERQQCLVEMFARERLVNEGEQTVFYLAQKLSGNIINGQWDVMRSSNGACYIRPPNNANTMILAGSAMSTDAFGVVVCLVALDRFSAKLLAMGDSKAFSIITSMYYLLLDVAATHRDAMAIYCVLDAGGFDGLSTNQSLSEITV